MIYVLFLASQRQLSYNTPGADPTANANAKLYLQLLLNNYNYIIKYLINCFLQSNIVRKLLLKQPNSYLKNEEMSLYSQKWLWADFHFSLKSSWRKTKCKVRKCKWMDELPVPVCSRTLSESQQQNVPHFSLLQSNLTQRSTVNDVHLFIYFPWGSVFHWQVKQKIKTSWY